jgi:hypothetical protein
VVIHSQFMRASFDEVAAWPLDRVLAANDLIDELTAVSR